MANPKEYTNGEITVFWKPEKCWHAAECVKGLPAVFNVNCRPWIDINAATNQEIIDTVEKCPSGALTFEWNAK